MIYIDGSIAQSVPEHPKRENIFSVSSAYGDAYLFQVYLCNISCKITVYNINWIYTSCINYMFYGIHVGYMYVYMYVWIESSDFVYYKDHDSRAPLPNNH